MTENTRKNNPEIKAELQSQTIETNNDCLQETISEVCYYNSNVKRALNLVNIYLDPRYTYGLMKPPAIKKAFYHLIAKYVSHGEIPTIETLKNEIEEIINSYPTLGVYKPVADFEIFPYIILRLIEKFITNEEDIKFEEEFRIACECDTWETEYNNKNNK